MDRGCAFERPEVGARLKIDEGGALSLGRDGAGPAARFRAGDDVDVGDRKIETGSLLPLE